MSTEPVACPSCGKPASALVARLTLDHARFIHWPLPLHLEWWAKLGGLALAASLVGLLVGGVFPSSIPMLWYVVGGAGGFLAVLWLVLVLGRPHVGYISTCEGCGKEWDVLNEEAAPQEGAGRKERAHTDA